MSNSSHDINFIRAFPSALKNDETMSALGKIIAKELQETVRMSRQNIIYDRIDELDEKLLDIIAYDLHIDWYDDAYPIDIKRKIIKDSVKVHKYMGTKYAVETALKNVYSNSEVKEWFDKGVDGEPYTFSVAIKPPETGITQKNHDKVIQKVSFYKNLRSHLKGVYYQYDIDGLLTAGAVSHIGNDIEIFPDLIRKVETAGCANIGAVYNAATVIEIFPDIPKDFQINGSRYIGGILQYQNITKLNFLESRWANE